MRDAEFQIIFTVANQCRNLTDTAMRLDKSKFDSAGISRYTNGKTHNRF